MRKTVRSSVALLAAVMGLSLLAAVPGSTAGSCDDASPLDPAHRTARLEEGAPGTSRTICVFYGPYTIPAGHDLSRFDVDLTLTDGFIVAGGPSLVTAAATPVSSHDLHIHHAHWWLAGTEKPNYGPALPFRGASWLAGAGEEQTAGDFDLVSAAEPDGTRYGLEMHRGDRVVLINMVHNKTTGPAVVFIKVDLRFVFGTRDQIAATTGDDFHPLTPVLLGGTFDVRRDRSDADGLYVYPKDVTGPQAGDVRPGVGRVWTSPIEGSIVIGAGHLHAGGLRAVVTNLGHDGEACSADRDDGIPGRTLYELDTIDRIAPMSEDFQIEITQPGFRADVRRGDTIALNGVYENRDHAWWEAMAFTGFYVDEHPVAPRATPDDCGPRLEGTPAGYAPPLGEAIPGHAWDGVSNRPWYGAPSPVCAPYGPPCNANQPVRPRGQHTNLITISGFVYTPGDLTLPPETGTPWLERGEQLRVINTDIAAYVRHSMTSCPAPCDGRYFANSPQPDGTFDSRALGYDITGGGSYLPTWTLDTAPLEPGRYTFFCRLHPSMRGAFEVVEA